MLDKVKLPVTQTAVTNAATTSTSATQQKAQDGTVNLAKAVPQEGQFALVEPIATQGMVEPVPTDRANVGDGWVYEISCNIM